MANSGSESGGRRLGNENRGLWVFSIREGETDKAVGSPEAVSGGEEVAVVDAEFAGVVPGGFRSDEAAGGERGPAQARVAALGDVGNLLSARVGGATGAEDGGGAGFEVAVSGTCGQAGIRSHPRSLSGHGGKNGGRGVLSGDDDAVAESGQPRG